MNIYTCICTCIHFVHTCTMHIYVHLQYMYMYTFCTYMYMYIAYAYTCTCVKGTTGIVIPRNCCRTSYYREIYTNQNNLFCYLISISNVAHVLQFANSPGAVFLITAHHWPKELLSCHSTVLSLGAVNYDYIVTNSINSLLVSSRCIPNGARTNH